MQPIVYVARSTFRNESFPQLCEEVIDRVVDERLYFDDVAHREVLGDVFQSLAVHLLISGTEQVRNSLPTNVQVVRHVEIALSGDEHWTATNKIDEP